MNSSIIIKQLIINPGSTSTKVAVYHNDVMAFEKTLRHSDQELQKFKNVSDQFEFRKRLILDAMFENRIDLTQLQSVVARGGLLKPIASGTYEVNDDMIHDLKSNLLGEHASNLGGIIARSIADQLNIPAYITDPVVVDEMEDVARISGHPNFERICIWHALNQKAVARRAAEDHGKKYEDMNFVVAHLGGGISVGAHKRGQVVDVSNALYGEGPFSPERSGSLPVKQLVDMCFKGNSSREGIFKMIAGKGGLSAYCGTNNAKHVAELASKGDKEARLVYHAMAYQIAKSIGEYAVVLDGNVDFILVTGGIAYDKQFVDIVDKKVNFIAEVITYPGEDELLALALGGLRVLRGIEKAKKYSIVKE